MTSSSKLNKKSLSITVSKTAGDVSALLYSPKDAECIMVFAHGAGAGIQNKFMEQTALSLAEQNIATLRFNFPYMEKGKKVPDNKQVSTAAVKAAVDKATRLFPKHPIFAGGKSFGGRMTSTAASEELLESVKGIIFFGFPLHAPGRPSSDRADHLFNVNVPMLFLQGSRDSLASLDLLKPVCEKLGNKADLFVIDGADHSFHVPKEYKLKDNDVINLMCREVKRWMSDNI